MTVSNKKFNELCDDVKILLNEVTKLKENMNTERCHERHQSVENKLKLWIYTLSGSLLLTIIMFILGKVIK